MNVTKLGQYGQGSWKVGESEVTKSTALSNANYYSLKFDTDQDLLVADCDPAITQDPWDTQTPATLYDFLRFLAKHGVAAPGIIGFKAERTQADQAEAEPGRRTDSYKILMTDPVIYVPKKIDNVKGITSTNVFSLFTCEHIENSPHLRHISTMQYRKKASNKIVPIRPGIYLKKSLRLTVGKVIRVM